jgi:uncharacterized protein YbjQ (UPF0145 family)
MDEWSEHFELIFGVGSVVLFTLLGLTVGRVTERRHFRNLAERERALAGVLVSGVRTFPGRDPARGGALLVLGEATVGADYFKMMLAAVRGLVGGEVRSYVTLAERARREAVARMLERARAQGYNAVCNVRLDTADIVGSSKANKKIVCVCVMASGTAYHAGTAGTTAG